MKILQLIYESVGSPFGFGGAGVRAYEIYRRLCDRHEITLLCMRYPGARDGEIQGLRHIFAGTDRGGLTRSVLAYTSRASSFVAKEGVDFDVIIENFLPSTPFFSKFRTRTPVVLQVQGVMSEHSLRKFNPCYSVPMYLVERYYPALHDMFIFVSDVTEEKVLSGVKRDVRLSRVVPNGINADLLDGLSPEGDYLLFFSRIDIYTKGLDILMQAFERLVQRFPEIRLVLAGHEADSFVGLTKRLPRAVKEKVEYAGFLTGDRKRALLSGARAVVLPSRHESSPISILEAAACGKALVVSDIAELKFVSENGFGLTFPSGSAERLEDTLERVLRDGALRRGLAEKGRTFAARFLWDDSALEFERTLESAVHGA